MGAAWRFWLSSRDRGLWVEGLLKEGDEPSQEGRAGDEFEEDGQESSQHRNLSRNKYPSTGFADVRR